VGRGSWIERGSAIKAQIGLLRLHLSALVGDTSAHQRRHFFGLAARMRVRTTRNPSARARLSGTRPMRFPRPILRPRSHRRYPLVHTRVSPASPSHTCPIAQVVASALVVCRRRCPLVLTRVSPASPFHTRPRVRFGLGPHRTGGYGKPPRQAFSARGPRSSIACAFASPPPPLCPSASTRFSGETDLSGWAPSRSPSSRWPPNAIPSERPSDRSISPEKLTRWLLQWGRYKRGSLLPCVRKPCS